MKENKATVANFDDLSDAEISEAMAKQRMHAQALGRLGGMVTSKAKTAAARRNAKLGGWPKGKKRGSAKIQLA